MKRFYLILFFFCSINIRGQKYNFVNWTVEDGLIQSQALVIGQDQYRHLWIGTEGGLSRFDGKKFTGFTVREGLIANHINSVLCDNKGNLWAATNYGISLFNGRTFKDVIFNDGPLHNITTLVQHHNNDIFALNIFNNLYRIHSAVPAKEVISGDSSEKVTALYKSPSGVVMAYVYGKGLYKLDNKWILITPPCEEENLRYISRLFITSSNDTLIIFNTGLYYLHNNRYVVFPTGSQVLKDIHVLSLAEDEKQNLWLGTENGAFKFEGQKLIHFNGKSGFTDNSVNNILKDIENNLWFATDADGIFKFRENTFTYYDKSSGLSNTIIMGVVQATDGKIYAAGYGGGLYSINDDDDIEAVTHNGPLLQDTKINSLYADDENNIWIGTIGKGVWKYNRKKEFEKVFAKNNPLVQIRGANSFLKDKKGRMLIGGNRGLFVLDGNNVSHMSIPGMIVTSLKQLNKDSILVATSKGLYIFDNNDSLKRYYENFFSRASVLCLAINGTNIWMGTTDKGVLNWNFSTRQLINYNTTHGLPSNFIYSIDVSGPGKAWIGTGFGISNIKVNKEGKITAIKNYGRSEGLLGMECSHNCILRAADSSLWFGTTKGLFHFNPSTEITEKTQPIVLLKSVKLFSSEIEDVSLFKRPGAWFAVPEGLKLYSKQNHLSFELGSIYFTNPEDVMYRYKLEGIDKEYTTGNNPVIIYPSLPPGKYTLMVEGITKSGVKSVNSISYSFEIEKAFYQTGYFQALVIFILISTGALLTYFFTRGRQKRKQKAKELLAKIREEEFKKLRQRTAEDFHDEMGNSLTRISVLTDVLKSKINGKESEVTRLVQQIKENTTQLYNGSRDIIWSLNSQNDGIYEIAEHIKEKGMEIFEDTSVEFNYNHNIKPFSPLKLKLDYSRNLTMIFKEAYANILKHARADKVEMIMELKDNNELKIVLRDNGKGFDPGAFNNGNGLRNMNNRVERMHGTFNVNSITGKGTEIIIELTHIFIN